MNVKTCSKCNLEKDLKDFSPTRNSKFTKYCKLCIAEVKRLKYIKHPRLLKSPILNGNKVCIKCLQLKNINKFSINKNLSIRNDCKACCKDRDFARKQEISNLLKEIKSKPCFDCNQIYPYYVMDFDHREGVVKINNVSQMRFCSKDKILKEIQKCDLVCANCHRERTFSRRNLITNNASIAQSGDTD